MALQFVALGIGLLGSILAFFATISPRWAVSDVSGNVIENHKTTIGLWKQCQELGVGLITSGDSTWTRTENPLL